MTHDICRKKDAVKSASNRLTHSYLVGHNIMCFSCTEGLAIRMPGFHLGGLNSISSIGTVLCAEVNIHYTAVHFFTSLALLSLYINPAHTV